MNAPGSIAIVGASVAGTSLARELRTVGFDGTITVIGAEAHQPYDRPPLSKTFLTGETTGADLALVGTDEDLGVDWRLGVRAVGLDAAERCVTLQDGTRVRADRVAIATGVGSARLSCPTPVTGVHTLLTRDDATALRAHLCPGTRLVIVGDGVIAVEVAFVAHSLGVAVTIISPEGALLNRLLPEPIRLAYRARIEAAGIGVVTGRTVTGLAGTSRLRGVELSDGTICPAETALVAIGARADAAWLAPSGVRTDASGGISCSADGATTISSVFALGDCAAWWNPHAMAHQRDCHWTRAARHATVVASAMLGVPLQNNVLASPAYVWSEHGDALLQVVGDRAGDAIHSITDADPTDPLTYAADLPGAALVARNDVVTGVVGFRAARLVAKWRRQIGAPIPVDAGHR